MALFKQRPNLASSVDVAPIAASTQRQEIAQAAPGFVPPERPITDRFLTSAQSGLPPVPQPEELSRRQRGSLAVLGALDPNFQASTVTPLIQNRLGLFRDDRQRQIDQQELKNLETAAIREQAIIQADDEAKGRELERRKTGVLLESAQVELEQLKTDLAHVKQLHDDGITSEPETLANNIKQLESVGASIDTAAASLLSTGTTEGALAAEALVAAKNSAQFAVELRANQNLTPELRTHYQEQTQTAIDEALAALSAATASGASIDEATAKQAGRPADPATKARIVDLQGLLVGSSRALDLFDEARAEGLLESGLTKRLMRRLKKALVVEKLPTEEIVALAEFQAISQPLLTKLIGSARTAVELGAIDLTVPDSFDDPRLIRLSLVRFQQQATEGILREFDLAEGQGGNTGGFVPKGGLRIAPPADSPEGTTSFIDQQSGDIITLHPPSPEFPGGRQFRKARTGRR